MADQLSSDLASLRINRDSEPKGRGPFGTIAAVIAVIGALVLGAGAWRVGSSYVEANVFKREVAITEVTMISPAQASVDLTTTGYVTPQRVSQVGAKVYGKVTKVLIKQGQHVNEGDVLLELDSVDQAAAIASGEARVAAAKARVAASSAAQSAAALQAKRARSMAEGEIGTKATAEDLEAQVGSLTEQVRAAEADVRAAQAEVSALRVGLRNLTLTAPISGTVLSKPPEVGENLGMMAMGLSSAGGTIEIADLTTLAVETDVPEQRLQLVQLGRPAEIVLDAFPSKRYRGKTIELIPRLNRAKATGTVKVAFVDAADGVLPDMSARISFLTKELDAETMKQPPKLVVPGSAVTERSGAKVVFVIEGERVRMMPIQIVAPNGSSFEIVGGPAAGTRVVRDPPSDLADGQPIKEKSSG